MSPEKCKKTAGEAIPTGTESLGLIRSRIRFHLAMGIAGYPRNAGVRRFMELTDPESGAAPAGKENAAAQALAESVRTQSAGTFLQDLRQEVLRRGQGRDRLPPHGGGGLVRPR